MSERYRRFERRMGWENQPAIVAVIGWGLIVEGVVITTTCLVLKLAGVV